MQGSPIAETSGEGTTVTLTLQEHASVDHAVLMEQISQGERVQEYVLEAEQEDGVWVEVKRGTAIGHKKIDSFAAIRTKQLRLRVTECAALPLIRSFKVY